MPASQSYYSTSAPDSSFAPALPVAPEAGPDDVRFSCWFDATQNQRLCSAKVTDVRQITCESNGQGGEDCYAPKSAVGAALPAGQTAELPAALPSEGATQNNEDVSLKKLANWQVRFFNELGSSSSSLATDAALLKPPWELLAADPEQNQDAAMAEMCEPQRAAAATEVGSHILQVMAYRPSHPTSSAGKVMSLKRFRSLRQQESAEKALRAEGEFLVNLEPRCAARQAAAAQAEAQRAEQIRDTEERLREIDQQIRESQVNELEDLMALQALRPPPPTFIVTPPSGPVFCHTNNFGDMSNTICN